MNELKFDQRWVYKLGLKMFWGIALFYSVFFSILYGIRQGSIIFFMGLGATLLVLGLDKTRINKIFVYSILHFSQLIVVLILGLSEHNIYKELFLLLTPVIYSGLYFEKNMLLSLIVSYDIISILSLIFLGDYILPYVSQNVYLENIVAINACFLLLYILVFCGHKFIKGCEIQVEDMHKMVAKLTNSQNILKNNIIHTYESIREVNESKEYFTASLVDVENNLNDELVFINDIHTKTEQVEKLTASTSKLGNQIQEVIQSVNIKLNENGDKIFNVNKQVKILDTSVNSTFESITKLQEKMENINILIHNIESISNQTNILSLNASIESVRAGEAGKGFSVVANSIRLLAQQSNISSSDITSEIRDLEEEIDRMSEQLNIEKEAVDISTKCTQDVQDNFLSLKENFDTASQTVYKQLEQSKTTERVFQDFINSLNQIDDISHKNTDTSEKISLSFGIHDEKLNNLSSTINQIKETTNAII